MSQSTLNEPETGLSCLRCRNCRLLPDTNMSEKTPVVWCDKKQDRTPLLVANRCGIADDRPRYIASRSGKSKPNKGGDRTGNASPVEIAYLLVNYPTGDKATLMHATQRAWPALRDIAWSNGARRDKALATTERRITRIYSTRGYTPEQREYILQRHASGEWPPMGTWARVDRRRYAAMRRSIIAGVAARGRAKSWAAIGSFVYRNAPAMRKQVQP